MEEPEEDLPSVSPRTIRQAELEGNKNKLEWLYRHGVHDAGDTLLKEDKVRLHNLRNRGVANDATSSIQCEGTAVAGYGFCDTCKMHRPCDEIIECCDRLRRCVDCANSFECRQCGRKQTIQHAVLREQDVVHPKLKPLYKQAPSQKMLVLFDLNGVLCWCPRDGKTVENAAIEAVVRPAGARGHPSYLYFRPGLRELWAFLKRQEELNVLQMGIYTTLNRDNACTVTELLLNHLGCQDWALPKDSQPESHSESESHSEFEKHSVTFRNVDGHRRKLWFFSQEDCEPDTEDQSAIFQNTKDRKQVFSPDVAAKAGLESMKNVLIVAGSKSKLKHIEPESQVLVTDFTDNEVRAGSIYTFDSVCSRISELESELMTGKRRCRAYLNRRNFVAWRCFSRALIEEEGLFLSCWNSFLSNGF